MFEEFLRMLRLAAFQQNSEDAGRRMLFQLSGLDVPGNRDTVLGRLADWEAANLEAGKPPPEAADLIRGTSGGEYDPDYGRVPQSPEVDLTQQLNDGTLEVPSYRDITLPLMRNEASAQSRRTADSTIALIDSFRPGGWEALLERVGPLDPEGITVDEISEAWARGKLDHQFLIQQGADPDSVAEWHKILFDHVNQQEGARVHQNVNELAGSYQAERAYPVSPSDVVNFYEDVAEAQALDPRTSGPNPVERVLHETGFGRAWLKRDLSRSGIPLADSLNLLEQYDRGLFTADEATFFIRELAPPTGQGNETIQELEAKRAGRQLGFTSDPAAISRLQKRFDSLLPQAVDRNQVLDAIGRTFQFGVPPEMREEIRRVPGMEGVDPVRLEKIIEQGQAAAFYAARERMALDPFSEQGRASSAWEWVLNESLQNEQDIPVGLGPLAGNEADLERSLIKGDIVADNEWWKARGTELDPANRYHQEAFRGLLKQMTGGQDTTSLTARLSGLSRAELEQVKAAVADPNITPTWFDVLGGSKINDESSIRIGPNHYFRNQEINPEMRELLGQFMDEQIAKTPPPYNPPTNPGMGPRSGRPWGLPGTNNVYEQLPWELGGRTAPIPGVTRDGSSPVPDGRSNKIMSDIDSLLAQAKSGRQGSVLDRLFPMSPEDQMILDFIDEGLAREAFDGLDDDQLVHEALMFVADQEAASPADSQRWGGRQSQYLSDRDRYYAFLNDHDLSPERVSYDRYNRLMSFIAEQRNDEMLRPGSFSDQVRRLQDTAEIGQVWPADPRRTAIGLSRRDDASLYLDENAIVSPDGVPGDWYRDKLAKSRELLTNDDAYRAFLADRLENDIAPDAVVNDLPSLTDALTDLDDATRFKGPNAVDLEKFASLTDLDRDALAYWIGAEPYNPLLDMNQTGDGFAYNSTIEDLTTIDEFERLRTGASPRERLMAQYASANPDILSPKIPQHNAWMENLFNFMAPGQGAATTRGDQLSDIDRILAENQEVMGGARSSQAPDSVRGRGPGAGFPGQTTFEFPPDRPTGGPQMPPTNPTRAANPFWFNNPPPIPPGQDTRTFLNQWLTSMGASPQQRARFWSNNGPGGRVVANDPFYGAERLRNAGLGDLGLGDLGLGDVTGEGGVPDMGPTRMGGGGQPFDGGSTLDPRIFNKPQWSPFGAEPPQPVRLAVEQGRVPDGVGPGTFDPFGGSSPLTPPPYRPKPPPYNPPTPTPPPYNPPTPDPLTPPPYRPTPPPYRPTPPPFNPSTMPTGPSRIPPPFDPSRMPRPSIPDMPAFTGPMADGTLLPDARNAKYVQPLLDSIGSGTGLMSSEGATPDPNLRRGGLVGQAKRAIDAIPGGWTYGKPGWSNMKNLAVNTGAGLAGGVIGSMGGQALDDSDWLGGEDSFFNDAAAKALKWGGFGAGFGPKGALIGALVGIGHEGLERVGILGDGSDDTSTATADSIYNAGLRAGVPQSDLDMLRRQYEGMLQFADTADDPEMFRQKLLEGFQTDVMGKYQKLTTRGDGTSPEEQQALAMAIQAQIGSMARPYADRMLRDADNVAASYDQIAASDPALAPFARQAADYARYTASRDATNHATSAALSPMYSSLMKQASYFNSAAAQAQQQMMEDGTSSTPGGLDDILSQYRQGQLAA